MLACAIWTGGCIAPGPAGGVTGPAIGDAAGCAPWPWLAATSAAAGAPPMRAIVSGLEMRPERSPDALASLILAGPAALVDEADANIGANGGPAPPSAWSTGAGAPVPGPPAPAAPLWRPGPMRPSTPRT